jgi:ABC-2 type transport system ATP-binding protein
MARREFMTGLTVFTAEDKSSVILSSHLVSDLERICDYLVVLVASRVLVAGDVDDLVARHSRVIGAPHVTLEDLVLAYMSDRPAGEAVR